MKGNYPYSYPHSAETKEKISVANTGTKNGMYGTMMTAEQKEYRSNLMKEKILSGEFTPNSNNRNTHWDAEYNGKNIDQAGRRCINILILLQNTKI